MKRSAILAATFSVLLLACSGGAGADGRDAESVAASPTAAPGPVEPFRELTGVTGWINSEPITISGQLTQGRVVLIDFWTYTCINCIRTMPFLRQWHEKYADRGLTIIGVHTPEFDFERVRENVVAAALRHGLDYPIAQDNDRATWGAFENRFWPAKYLIGVDGRLRFEHFGEGEYVTTELEIRAALMAAGWDVSDIPLGDVNRQPRDVAARRVTRELYGGYGRNYTQTGIYAGQSDYYDGADRSVFYSDDVSHVPGRWYLQGQWLNGIEAIEHDRATEDYEDYIALPFDARSVNVVLSSSGAPFDVRVELDGRPLMADEAGADIEFDGAGNSFFRADEARLYGLVELPVSGMHELKLRSNSDDFAVFAFTFGVYAEGP